MNVIVWPSKLNGNPYISIVKRGLMNQGVTIISLRDIVGIKYFSARIDAAIFSWYENLNTNNLLLGGLRIMKKKLTISYLKHLKKVKIVIVMHNKCDHKGKTAQASKMTRWLLLNSDIVLIHSHYSEQFILKTYSPKDAQKIISKCQYIPHPNYCNAYQVSQTCSYSDFFKDNSTMNLLYFGSGADYKNIDLLVQLAESIQDKKIRILIAGKISDDICERIKNRIGNLSNLTLSNKRIPDDELWSVIDHADCVVLPYKMDSVLNSGSAIMALTVGKNVICPPIGTMLDFPQELTYIYHYSSEQEHLHCLREAVLKVYQEFVNERSRFDARAKRLNEIVLSQYSEEKVCGQLAELMKN